MTGDRIFIFHFFKTFWCHIFFRAVAAGGLGSASQPSSRLSIAAVGTPLIVVLFTFRSVVVRVAVAQSLGALRSSERRLG